MQWRRVRRALTVCALGLGVSLAVAGCGDQLAAGPAHTRPSATRDAHPGHGRASQGEDASTTTPTAPKPTTSTTTGSSKSGGAKSTPGSSTTTTSPATSDVGTTAAYHDTTSGPPSDIIVSAATPTGSSSPTTPSTTPNAAQKIEAWWAEVQPSWARFEGLADTVQSDIVSGAWSVAAVTCNTAVDAATYLQSKPQAPYRSINKPWQEALDLYIEAYQDYESGLDHQSQAELDTANGVATQAATQLAAANVVMQQLTGQTIPPPDAPSG